MGKLFTKRKDGFKAFSTQGFKNLAPRLISNNSTVDIINSFPWTLTPQTSLALQETPYIKLTEFYLEESFLNQSFQAYGIRISTFTDFMKAVGSGLYADYNVDRLYQGLYDHKDNTGFVYKLPYFSREYLQTSNSWMAKPYLKEILQLQQDVVGYTGAAAEATIGGLAGAANYLGGALLLKGGNIFIRLAGGALVLLGSIGSSIGPGAANYLTKTAQAGYKLARVEQRVKRSVFSPIGGIDEEDPALDKPHIWNNTVPRSFNISFPLYNILTYPQDDKWNEQILRNWEFCYLLTYQNLFNKRNLFTGIPPVFYEIDIPGIHYTKAGYINNLRILNAGNIRSISLPIDGTEQTVNVPDAYVINFTITDFFTPSKNFMSSIGKPNKGTLIDSINENSLKDPTEVSDVELQDIQVSPTLPGTQQTPGYNLPGGQGA